MKRNQKLNWKNQNDIEKCKMSVIAILISNFDI